MFKWMGKYGFKKKSLFSGTCTSSKMDSSSLPALLIYSWIWSNSSSLSIEIYSLLSSINSFRDPCSEQTVHPSINYLYCLYIRITEEARTNKIINCRNNHITLMQINHLNANDFYANLIQQKYNNFTPDNLSNVTKFLQCQRFHMYVLCTIELYRLLMNNQKFAEVL